MSSYKGLSLVRTLAAGPRPRENGLGILETAAAYTGKSAMDSRCAHDTAGRGNAASAVLLYA